MAYRLMSAWHRGGRWSGRLNGLIWDRLPLGNRNRDLGVIGVARFHLDLSALTFLELESLRKGQANREIAARLHFPKLKIHAGDCYGRLGQGQWIRGVVNDGNHRCQLVRQGSSWQ